MDLEMMRVATPHFRGRTMRGAQNGYNGLPALRSIVVECLLALAQHTRGWAAIESVNLHEVVY